MTTHNTDELNKILEDNWTQDPMGGTMKLEEAKAYIAQNYTAKKEIDHSIDVRYETDVIEAFNKFVKKWCPEYYAHLIDDDENDGEFMREKIDLSTSEVDRLAGEAVNKERDRLMKSLTGFNKNKNGTITLYEGEKAIATGYFEQLHNQEQEKNNAKL